MVKESDHWKCGISDNKPAPSIGTIAASVKRHEKMKVKLCYDVGRRKGRWKETKTLMSRIVPETQKQQIPSNRKKGRGLFCLISF